MFNFFYRTVVPYRRNLGDSYLYKSAVGIFLRNISYSSALKPEIIDSFRPTLQNYEFSDDQISKLAKALPTIFSCNLQNNILPKLKFFLSIGISSSDLPKIIAGNPALLAGSVEKQLIPCYNFLKTLVDSDDDVVRTIKRSPRIFSCSLKVMVPNVELLVETGVPQSAISYLLTHYPHSLQMKCEKFKKCVDEAINLGFEPSRMLFIRAVHVLCDISKECWENKAKVYRSFGLSDTEILSAFRMHPFCMKLSEEKIMRGMKFFVKEMGCSPADVARTPVALFYSMERRIIPRCRVIKLLRGKGFLKESFTSFYFLALNYDVFVARFVHKYEKDLPEIMDVYLYGKERA